MEIKISNPDVLKAWDDSDKRMEDQDAKWCESLRFQGVKGSHPYDGWVDDTNNSFQFRYPFFNDSPMPGDMVVLGGPRDSIVHVVEITQLAPSTAGGSVYWFKSLGCVPTHNNLCNVKNVKKPAPSAYQYTSDIHKDCFKLRILVTDGCNQRCSYCLNDFQEIPKSGEASFIDVDFVHNMAQSYMKLCKEKGIGSEIYLSGGEPTLHPKFAELVKGLSLLNPDKFVLCTNGLVHHPSNRMFNELHISAHWNSLEPGFSHHSSWGEALWVCQHMDRVRHWEKEDGIERHLTFNAMFGDLSCYHTADQLEKLYSCIKHIDPVSWKTWRSKQLPRFKVWADIFRGQDVKYMSAFQKFCRDNPEWIHRGPSFLQSNRGSVCKGCTKNCVTLKALWLFPTMSCSPCPQGVHKPLMPKTKDMLNTVRQAYEGHLGSMI